MSEKLARRFHEIYERLAPLYGYKTREDTREFDSQSNNGRLMIAVASEIEREFEYENTRLKGLVEWLEIIESDLREYLEVRAVKHEWQKGHPEHEEPVLIYRRRRTGTFYYETDRWCSEDNCWNYFINDDVLGWKEIEPFDLEIIEEGE